MDTLPPTVGDDVGKGAAPNVVYTYTGKRIALYIGNLTWVSKLTDYWRFILNFPSSPCFFAQFKKKNDVPRFVFLLLTYMMRRAKPSSFKKTFQLF